MAAHAQLRPMIYTETTVERPVSEVWSDWTTPDGIGRHFSDSGIEDNIEIDLRPGGDFNIGYLPNKTTEDKPPREAGHILGLQTPTQKGKAGSHMIQFTWPVPPHITGINNHMTSVQMWFVPVGDHTRIRLFQTGFGDSPKWLKAREYFEQNWLEALERYDLSISSAK